MYSVTSFGHMALDGVRMDAYARAIARAVRPGSVVVDIGAGTGILSLLAARAGARRVHAVDLNPAVWLVRDLAAEWGLSDRITVHHESSWTLALPEPADVIISDLRGRFPIFEGHVATLADARSRWLAPGGTLLPQKDELRVALVEASNVWRHIEEAWTPFERRGVSARALRTSALNSVYGDGGSPIPSSDVLTTSATWGEIRYGERLHGALEPTVSVEATRGGTAHGLAVWFDATITEGIGFSNAPGCDTVYGRTFLPLLEPVTLDHGDVVRLTLRVDARGTRWAWDTEVHRAGGARGPRFRQATFLGRPTSPEEMLRESVQFMPVCSDKGGRVRRLLELMDGTRSVDELARAIHDERLDAADELDDVRDLVARYAR